MKSPFGRGITLLRGLANHGYYPLANWDDPPSGGDSKGIPSLNPLKIQVEELLVIYPDVFCITWW